MRFEKALVEKWVEALVEKAEDCFDLAEIQHKTADKQHEIAEKQRQLADKQQDAANKIDKVGRTLITSAVALKDELEIDAGRTSPRLPESPGVLPEAGSVLKEIPK
jgi:hypothetical protein